MSTTSPEEDTLVSNSIPDHTTEITDSGASHGTASTGIASKAFDALDIHHAMQEVLKLTTTVGSTELLHINGFLKNVPMLDELEKDIEWLHRAVPDVPDCANLTSDDNSAIQILLTTLDMERSVLGAEVNTRQAVDRVYSGRIDAQVHQLGKTYRRTCEIVKMADLGNPEFEFLQRRLTARTELDQKHRAEINDLLRRQREEREALVSQR